MRHRLGPIVVLCVCLAALLLPGCSAPIPREPVPAGWALNVHQPGEWWTQPLIPRSVIVQRCPPSFGWRSEPDLTRVTALPPGSDVNYILLTDDYHCDIGWSEPTSEVDPQTEDLTSEPGLRRVCSSTGLPLDDSWRFLGLQGTERAGGLPDYSDPGSSDPEAMYSDGTTAGFIDEYGTVVTCVAGGNYGGAFLRLSIAAGSSGADADPVCPVAASDLAAGGAEDNIVTEYRLRGAGAVLGADGRLLTEARTLRIGLVGDSVTTSHPIVDGIAIVDAWVAPQAAIGLDRDKPPPVTGSVLDADGKVLATCRR